MEKEEIEGYLTKHFDAFDTFAPYGGSTMLVEENGQFYVKYFPNCIDCEEDCCFCVDDCSIYEQILINENGTITFNEKYGISKEDFVDNFEKYK